MILQQIWKQWAPPWFQDKPNISTFYEAVGATLDPLAQRVLDGRLASVPWAGPGVGVEEPRTATGQRWECQPDALPYHSLDRGIQLYKTEGLQSQRQRLAAWWPLRARRGTHWGEIEHVRPYFADRVAAGFAYPTIAIVFQSNEGTPAAYWYQMDPSGGRTILRVSPSNFNIGGVVAARTQWAAFVDMTGTGYTAPHTYDSGGIYDTSGWQYDEDGATPFTVQAQADIAGMFSSWHSALSWLTFLAIVWPVGGGAAFPTAAGVPTQDATGWWSLPNGAGTWAGLVNPTTGLGTRPPNFQFILDNQPPPIV